MLGRTLGIKRWLSLVVLTFGVSIVSLPSSNDNSLTIHDFSDHFFPRSVHELGQAAGATFDVARELTKRGMEGLATELTKRSATYEGIKEDQDGGRLVMNYSAGLTACLVAAVVSGVTGVYFEKVLKDSSTNVSVWTRNIQLSFYSLFPALFVGVIYNDGEEIAKHGFFDGYNSIVWTAIVFQAVGGLLSSICINYADNIAKNFATSISIVISCVFSVFFFNFDMTSSVCFSPVNVSDGHSLTPSYLQFIIGTALVIGSTYLYSTPDRKRSRPPPINIVDYEKISIDHTPRLLDQNLLNVNPMDSARATSRPSSPSPLARTPSSRGKLLDE